MTILFLFPVEKWSHIKFKLILNIGINSLHFLIWWCTQLSDTAICTSYLYVLSYFSKYYSVQPKMHMQVQGVVQDRSGRTVATLFGKWDESMHYVMGDCFGKGKGSEQFSEAHLLWKRSKPPKFPTRYNLTRFAITLNELTPGLKVKFTACCTKLHQRIILLFSGSYF